MRLLFVLIFAGLLSFAQATAANKQLPKHHHSSSSSSSKNDLAFDGAFTQGSLQTISTPGGSIEIEFVSNQPGSPVNISHPFSNDSSKFGIKKTGTYLIGWTLNISTNAIFDLIQVQLFNASTSKVISPNPIQIFSLESSTDSPESVSSQTLLELPSGTILQLIVTSQVGGAVITNPSFFITRIDDVE